jgi:hypothetical protein
LHLHQSQEMGEDRDDEYGDSDGYGCRAEQ